MFSKLYVKSTSLVLQNIFCKTHVGTKNE